jgi:hypothetical protein
LLVLQVVDVVGVDESCLLRLVDGVEKAKHLLTDQLVVPVDSSDDGEVAAVAADDVVDVGQRTHAPLPPYNRYLGSGDGTFSELALDEETSAVF